jgi:hypothetical protein
MRPASLGITVAAVLLAACSGVRVDTDYDPAVDFAPLRSFAWLEEPLREEPRPENAVPSDPFTRNTLIDKRVRDDIAAQLVSRGYRAAAEGEAPDFLVRYEVVSRQIERDYPVYVGGGYGYGYRHGYYGSGVGYGGSTTYDEGTLIIDVIDPASQQIAWRGYGTSQSRDAWMDADRLHTSVSEILKRFPPGAQESD